MKKRSKNQYWTNQQEELVKALQKETEHISKSRLYNELRPAILRMCEAVLKTYSYTKNYHKYQINDLISNCESHLYTKIALFNPANGTKAFSYFGTIAKHFYYDHFSTINRNNVNAGIPIYLNDDGELHIDVIDETKSIQVMDEEFKELKTNAILRVQKYLQECVDNQKIVFRAILELLNQTGFNEYYATYFLLKKTKMTSQQLYLMLKKYGMDTLIVKGLTLSKIEERLSGYRSENNITEYNKYLHNNYVKDCLNNFKITPKTIEREYKIQQKPKRKAKVA